MPSGQDWEGYKKTYQNIHRMDRILKSEGLSPNDYKVAKQEDALMLFYNLSETTVSSLLSQLGYNPRIIFYPRTFIIIYREPPIVQPLAAWCTLI